MIGLEGNTRELLRRLRDSLMNGGWDDYRRKQVRSLAETVLRYLGEAEVVSPTDVGRISGELDEAGLHTVALPLLTFDDENEVGDEDRESAEDEVSG